MESRNVCYNINKLRALRGYTQCYMADELKITQGAYSLIEIGKSKLEIQSLEQIAAILNTDINTILNLEEHLNNIAFNIS
ncbi:MAG: helix-turn-helix domain-containing protein [Bacteroidia bacterium]